MALGPSDGTDKDRPLGPRTGDPPVIVGIGASAGGILALQRFFAATPNDTGAAFVIVYSHTQGFAPETIVADLARLSGLPTVICVDPMRPQANHIYVAPAACILASVAGSRMLSPMIASAPRISGNIASIALKASAAA